MKQFKAFDDNIEVSGAAILAILKGFDIFEYIGFEILKHNGLENIKPSKWYPQQKWLDSLKEIYTEIGSGILTSIGKTIPNSAYWPDNINNIADEMKAIDIAYHLNHRKNNILLYNSETGEMGDGIGNYKVDRIEKNRLEVVCNNPYPCDFDMGIIQGVAEKYEHKYKITVKHSENVCRKKGNDNCIYIVSWENIL